MRRLTGRPSAAERSASPTQTWNEAATTQHQVMALQQAAGNRAVSALVVSVQRCGGEVHAGCPCAEEGVAQGAEVQRTAAVPTDVVQREGDRDPADLTGTAFASFDKSLKDVLKDKTKFAWSKPTLADSLNELSNGQVATLARIGAMISATAPFLWAFVSKIYGGGWITDNFGTLFDWTDGAALGAKLADDPNWCRDNPLTATHYHGTTSAYRQIAKTPGAAALHVITGGRTEVHVDVHQPVEGKETSWPWAGQCNYDLSAWWDHAGDVTAGKTGARATPVGRFAVARNAVPEARRRAYYDKDIDEPDLAVADRLLEGIWKTVQKYAAMGAMVGNEWEGDQRMLKDAPVMQALEQAEAMIRKVQSAQDERRPEPTPMGP